MSDDIRKPGERLQAAAANARAEVSNRIGDIARSLTFKALLLGVVGLLILFWPAASFRFLVIAIGVLLVIDGVSGIVGMFKAGERSAFLGQGIFSLIAGAALLIWPEASISTLMLLLGLWALAHGALLLWGLRDVPADAAYRGTQRNVAIVMAVLGLALLVWPNLGVVTFSWLIGLAALALAAALFWLSSHMKTLKQRVGVHSN